MSRRNNDEFRHRNSFDNIVSFSFRQRYRMKSRNGFTLVEIMIVVLIIGLLLAIALPNFARARETARQKSCVANLRRLQFAKDAYMMDKNQPADIPESDFTDARLYGDGTTPGYLGSKPGCPGGGTYTLGAGNVLPACDYNGSGFTHNYDGD